MGEAFAFEFVQAALGGVKRRGVDTFALQGLEHATARHDGHITLSGQAAHEDSDFGSLNMEGHAFKYFSAFTLLHQLQHLGWHLANRPCTHAHHHIAVLGVVSNDLGHFLNVIHEH